MQTNPLQNNINNTSNKIISICGNNNSGINGGLSSDKNTYIINNSIYVANGGSYQVKN